jgi:putative DeoR family transcriptional regulator (stage III sporulation protein D)
MEAPASFLYRNYIYMYHAGRFLQGGPEMNDLIWKRVLDVGHYLINTRATVRETAKVFGVSKSTVHKDLTERLSKINPQLFLAVKEVLEFNKSERHIRGGEATKRKYKQK